MVHGCAHLANHLVFLLHTFCMIFIYCKDFKTQKNTQFGALAGQYSIWLLKKWGSRRG
jgi:hypothetical protein